MARTDSKIDTSVTREGSRPVRYELIDKHGFCVGAYSTAEDAGKMAGLFFPGEQQDPDRTGKGWDVQMVGADR